MQPFDEQKLKSVVFFIEATSFEQFSLWKEYHKESQWESNLLGFSMVIGFLDKAKKKPVNVSFTFVKIFDKLICFYDVVSRYSDSTMVEEWLWKNFPVKWDGGIRLAYTDANNFHLAFNRCKYDEK